MRLPSYCERTADGLWAEPLNALTNAAFLLAAWASWRLWTTQPNAHWRRQPDILTLIGLVGVIGIGSLLWHTVAKPWAFWLDALPIVLFIHLFLFSFLWRLLHWGWPAIIAVFVVYEVLTVLVMGLSPAGALNDSAGYLPVVIFLWLMAWTLRLRRHPLWLSYVGCGALFAVSLTFRIVDPALCARLPVGTHFLWHALNGWLLYLLMVGLIRHGMSRP